MPFTPVLAAIASRRAGRRRDYPEALQKFAVDPRGMDVM